MNTKPVVRFGVFELDLAARELRKRGVRVRLQDQPFRVLEALLEKPGEIVTRDELKERLWAQDEFVEFDKSLNTSVQKIRQALGDSSESPRFLETVPRLGYKFIAPLEQSTPPPTIDPEPKRRKIVLTLGAGGLLAIGAVLGVWLASSPSLPSPLQVRKFKITLELAEFTEFVGLIRPVPSPSGRYLAWRQSFGGREMHLRDLTMGSSRMLTVTNGHPFWSPDSKLLGTTSNREINVIDIESGASRTLISWHDKPTWFTRGATWSPDGRTIVFAAGSSFESMQLYQVPARGGATEPLVGIEQQVLDRETRHFDPHFLATRGRRRALLFVEGGPNARIIVVDLDSGRRRTIAESDQPLRYPVYAPSGHVLYQESTGFSESGARLWAVPFSLEDLDTTGDPFLVAKGAIWPGVSADGLLSYLDFGAYGEMQLVWRDRAGRKVGEIGEPQQEIGLPVLSPDGKEVVVMSVENGVRDVWVHEVERPVKRRLTFDTDNQDRPTWRPSGREITFSSTSTSTAHGRMDIYVTAANGSEQPRPLYESPISDFGYEWSPDGKYLVGGGAKWLWYLRQVGDGWEKVILADDRFDHVAPELSPDGRFLAYQSDETGRGEVWVRPFPEGDGKWLISTNGGGQPRWQGSGRELFYVQRGTLMAVPVTFEPKFKYGAPQPLFDGHGIFAGRGQRYDVSADGQRFVVVEHIESRPELSIQVVLNWYEEFRGRE